jgi:hypothetical protein
MRERRLTAKNIDSEISQYRRSIAEIGSSISILKGIDLFVSMKRQPVGTGPYPHVTLFEAANRIMTDLVILHGVSWLLRTKTFPFDSYTVEYGNEDHNSYDITAKRRGRELTGEAFNVAPSFYQGKKSAMLKKLRNPANSSDYKLIMANSDAVKEGYRPVMRNNEHYLFVDIASDEATLFSK